MITPDYVAETYVPPANCTDTSGPVVQINSLTATSSTINIGCSIQESNLVGSSGLKRYELALLEEEYGDKCWHTPFPWKPECRFDPEDYYVPLNLNDQGRDWHRPRTRKAEVGNLFSPHAKGGERLPRRILLTGGAGFGKTALCMKVALDWKEEKTSIRALPWNTSLIVLYNLKLFDSNDNLEEEVLNFLYERHSVEGKTVEVTRETLRSLGQDLVLFLDGYDELDEEGKRKLEALIVACKRRECYTFSSARILVTSRPIERKQFFDLFEKYYSIGNLSIRRKKLLVQKFFRNCSIKSEVLFRRYSDLELDEESPLTLFFLCWVTQHHKFQDLLSEGEGQWLLRLVRGYGLRLMDKEMKTIFFRFRQLCFCYVRNYKRNFLEIIYNFRECFYLFLPILIYLHNQNCTIRN